MKKILKILFFLFVPVKTFSELLLYSFLLGGDEDA